MLHSHKQCAVHEANIKQKKKKNQASRFQIVMRSGYYKASVNCLIKLMEQKHTNLPFKVYFNFIPILFQHKHETNVLKY